MKRIVSWALLTSQGHEVSILWRILNIMKNLAINTTICKLNSFNIIINREDEGLNERKISKNNH